MVLSTNESGRVSDSLVQNQSLVWQSGRYHRSDSRVLELYGNSNSIFQSHCIHSRGSSLCSFRMFSCVCYKFNAWFNKNKIWICFFLICFELTELLSTGSTVQTACWICNSTSNLHRHNVGIRTKESIYYLADGIQHLNNFLSLFLFLSFSSSPFNENTSKILFFCLWRKFMKDMAKDRISCLFWFNLYNVFLDINCSSKYTNLSISSKMTNFWDMIWLIDWLWLIGFSM